LPIFFVKGLNNLNLENLPSLDTDKWVLTEGLDFIIAHKKRSALITYYQPSENNPFADFFMGCFKQINHVMKNTVGLAALPLIEINDWG